ncbi:hypothetical protein BH23CHL6_BH23CHL6_12280 [soil metagenome]
MGALVTLLVLAISPVTAKNYSDWSEPASIESLPGSSSEVNTEFLDGCPIQSPDGLSLYMASNRTPGGQGNIDIWVAHRSSVDVGFGTPVNLGEPVNSPLDDFCPTPVRGKGLFFVSTRGGNPDIYFSRNHPDRGWTTPLPVSDINSPLPELSPSYFEADGRAFLYFSRGPDIFSAERQPDGSWGSIGPVDGLNSPTALDLRPNVRKDGLEIVFDSNRHGRADQDLYFSVRSSVDEAWSPPTPAGSGINTTAMETRGSYSWDGETLLFGRVLAGVGSDIFISTRTHLTGAD